MSTQRSYDVESALVEEDLDFQHRQWRIQDIAWWLVVLVPGLAMIGFCGGSGISERHISNARMQVQYERFARRLGESTIEVSISSLKRGEDSVSLFVDTTFVDAMNPSEITPTPRRVRAEGEFTEYVFDRRPSLEAFKVQMQLHPEHWGRSRGVLRADDTSSLTLHSFVWP